MQQLKNRPFLARLGFAVAGIRHALRTERSLLTQAVVLGLVVIALILLRPGFLWCALIAIASAAVMAAELFM